MRAGADAGQVDRFADYRESMHEALQRFVQQSAVIELIEAHATTTLASTRRDSARRAAVMWAVAAQVEAQAARR